MTIALDTAFAQDRTRSAARPNLRGLLLAAALISLFVAARRSPELREVLVGLLLAGGVWTAALLFLGSIRAPDPSA